MALLPLAIFPESPGCVNIRHDMRFACHQREHRIALSYDRPRFTGVYHILNDLIKVHSDTKHIGLKLKGLVHRLQGVCYAFNLIKKLRPLTPHELSEHAQEFGTPEFFRYRSQRDYDPHRLCF
jgi:hypothetical protein